MSEAKKEETLSEIKNKLVLSRLAQFNGNRTATAESLGISTRGLRDILVILKNKGFKFQDASMGVKRNKISGEDPFLWEALPTNEHRIHYKNKQCNMFDFGDEYGDTPKGRKQGRRGDA